MANHAVCNGGTSAVCDVRYIVSFVPTITHINTRCTMLPDVTAQSQFKPAFVVAKVGGWTITDLAAENAAFLVAWQVPYHLQGDGMLLTVVSQESDTQGRVDVTYADCDDYECRYGYCRPACWL